MPEYPYKCTKCGKSFSRFMAITEVGRTKVACPKCASVKVARRFTGFNAVTSKKS